MPASFLSIPCCVLLSLSSTLALAHAEDLNVGHVAPPMDVIRWVKGKPVPQFEKGQVYVVEFWATWCGPCKKSIPHLTELAHKYAGKATFIGVDVFDQASEPTDLSYVKKVKKFVDSEKQAMDYRIAVDGPKSAMADNWLKAYGEGGIPTAFVVNRDGYVAWIGYPTEGLDEAVGQVLGTDYDLTKAAETRLAAKKAEESLKPLPQRFLEEMRQGHWDAANRLSDEMMATMPASEKTYASSRVRVLLHTNPQDAYEYARKLSNGLYKGFAPELTGMARTIAQEDVPNPDLDLALLLAQQSVDASQGKDPRYLETLAIVRFRRGEAKKAAGVMETAIQIGQGAKDIGPSFLKEMRDRLALYNAKANG